MMHMAATYKKALSTLILICLLVTFTSARRAKRQTCPKVPQITSVHIVDHNGFVEAITNKDRLAKFAITDFLAPQPYQKILRIYERDGYGNIYSVVTSYYDNGNVKQMLEIVNGRAQGQYYEWHPNGMMSVCCKVIGGTGDITSCAEKTWLFDGTSYAWNEDGALKAEIPYAHGELDGISTYYHAKGQLWKKVPFKEGQVQGTLEIYKKDGELLQQTQYCDGQKNGTSIRYWSCSQIASVEDYRQGLLEKGSYFKQNGESISEINSGTGLRAIFDKTGVHELQEYKMGVPDGEVKVFRPNGQIHRSYRIKNGVKHGEEIEYYEFTFNDTLQPRLSIPWHEGSVHGVAKTWYPNGIQESQREMSKNQKNGLGSAWYVSGNLMLMEEYEKNRLVRGDYFRDGDRYPISQINDGNGTATIFDSEGNLVQKVNYHHSKPEL